MLVFYKLVLRLLDISIEYVWFEGELSLTFILDNMM